MMRLLRQLAALSGLGCAGPLLLVLMVGCGPHVYQRDQAIRDVLNPSKIRERQDQALLQMERDALAAEMNARAAALESHARQLKKDGSTEAAEKSQKEAKELREEVKRGDPLR